MNARSWFGPRRAGVVIVVLALMVAALATILVVGGVRERGEGAGEAGDRAKAPATQSAGPDGSLRVEPDQQARSGIVVAQAVAAGGHETVRAFATVLDPARLSELVNSATAGRAQAAAARARLIASKAAADRAELLYRDDKTVSLAVHFIVHLSTAPGTSLDESARLGARIAAELRSIPAVRSVAQRIGRAEAADDTWGTHYSEVEVDLKPLSGAQLDAAQNAIRERLNGLVGVTASVKTFLTERVEETLSGTTAPVAINLYGDDLDALDRSAQDLARIVGGVPGAAEVQVQSPPGLPQVTIRLRQPDLERFGLTKVDVLESIRTAYEGEAVGQAYDGARVFNVISTLDAASRSSPALIGELPLRGPMGTFIQLKDVADIFQAAGRYQIQHQGGRRLQTVTVTPKGGDVTAFVSAAKAAVAQRLKLPPGMYVTFTGAAEGQAQSQHDLALNALLAGVGIVLLLSVATRNWRNLVLVLVNLPFGLVGGVLAVLATGGSLSLGSLVGFVTLFGITLRNSIMMISHFEHLVDVEGRTWGLETAITGAADRLVPILMTSIVTGLGLLPLALGRGDPGREIEGPMAVVILGGLASSMVLNLLVLPTLALMFGRFDEVAFEHPDAPPR